MAGLRDTDIMLDDDWQLTQAANGDAPLASGFDCIMQDIRLEAVTQAGDLFYDLEWGWSLLEFMHSEEDPLTRIEIEQRVRTKLEKREVIDPDTISVTTAFADDILTVYAAFRFINDEGTYSVTVSLDRVSVEVIAT